jgi:hypothetical protein
VLINVNLIAQTILLPIDLRLFRPSEFAAISGAVSPCFPVERGFLRFESGCFARGKLARPHTLCNSVLLIFLALCDSGGLLCRGQSGGEEDDADELIHAFFSCLKAFFIYRGLHTVKQQALPEVAADGKNLKLTVIQESADGRN